MQTRQILRALGKTPKGKIKLREILYKNRHKLTTREFNILEYTYLHKMATFDVSDKMGVSNSYYYIILNTALAKVEMFINGDVLSEIVEMI